MRSHPGSRVLVVSVTEDQAELMLARILDWLPPGVVAKGKNKPTKHKVVLNNKSWVMTKAAGSTGAGMRGLTVDVVIVDEAAHVPEIVFSVLSPMLLTTGGRMWLLSTPNAMEGYFFKCYTDPAMGFVTFHVNSEEVAEGRAEPLRSIMLAHLEREKVRMSALEYAQQYLAQFQEELSQLFSDDLIKSCMTLTRPEKVERGEYYLGMDIAKGVGLDETTFEVLQKSGKKFLHREHQASSLIRLMDTIHKAISLHESYKFRGVYIDSSGVGSGVYDFLASPSSPLRNVVVSIENASRTISPNSNRSRKILKEDLYFNLLRMMEAGEILLLDGEDIFLSLKSIMLEHDKRNNNIYIYGRYSHIAEGLIRAAWASHNQRLELWAR